MQQSLWRAVVRVVRAVAVAVALVLGFLLYLVTLYVLATGELPI